MGNDRTQTIRQEIIQYLTASPLTVRDISQMAGIREKDVFHHLASIEKTLKQRQATLKQEPYRCMDCGFRFTKRKTFKKPGKCPTCRDGRIEPALFWIVPE